MTLTNTTQNTIQKRTERSEVHSRPKGVNPQDQSRKLQNQKLIRIHQKTGSFGKVQEELIRQNWETNFRPHWFITLLWNDLPTRFDTAEGHAKIFRNVFLTKLLRCNSPTKIPDPPARPQLVFFHERKPVITRGRQITAFHTHLHLGPLPDHQNHLWSWTTWSTRRLLQRSGTSSRPPQRGMRVWWSNHGSRTTMRSITWRTTTPIGTIRMLIWWSTT